MLKHIALVALAALLTACSSSPKPKPPGKGTLILAGGGTEPSDVLNAFYQASGGSGKRIGIIPTASASPEAEISAWTSRLAAAGMTLVLLDIRTREDADTKTMLEAAKTCDGFWFAAGDQVRLADRLVDTQMQKVLLDKFRDGACIAASSESACIMSKTMLTGRSAYNTDILSLIGSNAYRTREGMGLLPDHCITDQHVIRRNRQNRLFSVLMQLPDKLGLGIDENTALVVKDGVATVYGSRVVMVFDPAGMTKTPADGFQHMKIHVLKNGQRINLATRELTL
jgi:cyanophycinase